MMSAENLSLSEEFAEDFQGVYVYRRVGMEFYVAEDFLRYFVSYGAVQRYEHGLSERKRHKLLDDRGLK